MYMEYLSKCPCTILLDRTCSYHAHSPGLVYTMYKEFNTSSTGEITEYKRLNG